MSKDGAPELAVPNVRGARVGIVASQWHADIMDLLIAGATKACEQAGASVSVIRAPGTFELPVVAQKAATRHDLVVALGVVIRGGTPHFDYVCQAATYGLSKVALTSNKPVGFGVLTCDTVEQALARSGGPGAEEDKGFEAAAAALQTYQTMREIR